ncbi:MAG: plasmid stabilization system protein [uncultured bacterium]|nr:MAG: plasmid stabilization system protein [uncultured bacterium]
MNYNLSFLPEVEEDAFNAYVWYESKSNGLGEDFLRVFYAHSSEINKTPFLYQIIYNNFRRCILKRFPYAVYYIIDHKTIIVTGLFHCARNPNIINDNLINRANS